MSSMWRVAVMLLFLLTACSGSDKKTALEVLRHTEVVGEIAKVIDLAEYSATATRQGVQWTPSQDPGGMIHYTGIHPISTAYLSNEVGPAHRSLVVNVRSALTNHDGQAEIHPTVIQRILGRRGASR